MTSVYGGNKVWFIGKRTWKDTKSVEFQQISEDFSSYKQAKKHYDKIVKHLKTKLNKTKEI